MNTEFRVISPDGFTIEYDKPTYPSLKQAEIAFENWKERYNNQGYYSSNNGRIPLDELKAYCKIEEVIS